MQNFTLDTIPEGEDVFLSRSGIIEKWRWFSSTAKYPLIVIYYDTLGEFESFRGSPFLSSGRKDSDSLFVEVVQPLSIRSEMGFRILKDDSIILERVFIPGLWEERGTCSVLFDAPPFEDPYRYYAYYYIVDEQRNILDSAYVEFSKE